MCSQLPVLQLFTHIDQILRLPLQNGDCMKMKLCDSQRCDPNLLTNALRATPRLTNVYAQ